MPAAPQLGHSGLSTHVAHQVLVYFVNWPHPVRVPDAGHVGRKRYRAPRRTTGKQTVIVASVQVSSFSEVGRAAA